MKRISKRIISWILGAFAFVALALGTVFAMPQVETAKADTPVTFNAAALGDASHETYGTSIRFDTAGQTWASYHNWASAADWTSIADYTTVNGRTVTEINNATTHTQKITLMMQPAGSFSFLRLYIPAEIIPLGEVKSMGILDGWSFNNGANNFTSSAVTFLRNGDTMVTADSYSATKKLNASNITISDAKLVNLSNSTWGTDSYTVNIDIGQQITSEYQTMYAGYKSIRNAIYINGKSIEEWNTQKIAEDAKFNNPATYSFFPQNSADPSHLDPFVKPVGLWATSTGFRLSIFQELVADLETVTVTVGSGCMFAGSFMVEETVSKTVLTQDVVDITDKLTFLDNSHNSPAEWGPTSMYMINTNGESLWTKSPLGGCLNEYDPTGAGGGQVQMKYIYFNGTSLYDINKSDNGAYGSTQGNIAGGGIYAPILVTMSAEVGSTLKLTVPTSYTNGKAAHEEIIIKKGFNFVENGVSYYVRNDVVFTKTASGWQTEVEATEIETEVTGIKTYANRTDGGNNENFVIFQLSNNDYVGVNTVGIKDISSLFGYIEIDGKVLNATPGEPFFNVWGTPNSIAFRAPGLDAAGLQQVEYITIKAGAKFPSYNVQYNGAPLTYYVTTEDITFIHSIPNDTWTVGTLASEFTVTYEVDGVTQTTQTVARGEKATAPETPTKAEDENYIYIFKQWTLNGVAYDFDTPVTSDITLVAEFTKMEKGGTVDLTAGLSFAYQGHGMDGAGETETYLITTSTLAWQNAGTGRINKDYPDALNYIYFNGRSIAEINAESNDAYGSSFSSIANGECAPIAVLYNKYNENSSYLQIWVPTGYPTLGATAKENHKSIEIKAGFTITQNNTTYTVTEDVKWMNVNGVWLNADNAMDASEITIGNPRVEGNSQELYKVDVTFDNLTFTCNNYDFMYGGQYATYRKFIFINGVSVYDINENTDDSAYVYSTFPMTGADDAMFAKPIMIETYTGNGENPTNTLTLWIHKTYAETLGETFIVTLGGGFTYTNNSGVTSLPVAENVDYDMIATVSVNDGMNSYTTAVIKGSTVAMILGTPSKPNTATELYTFDAWYDTNTNEALSLDSFITEDMSVEARFDTAIVQLIITEVVEVDHQLKTGTDNWLVFKLSESDYANATENYSMGSYDEFSRIGFLDNVVLKGAIVLGSKTVSEATLRDVCNTYGPPSQGPLLNLWGEGKLGIRLPVGNGVEEIVIKEGCCFPSYAYVSGGTTDDIRYMVEKEISFVWDGNNLFRPEIEVKYDIKMATGASVRLVNGKEGSGIRFETRISEENILEIQQINSDGTEYSVSFGTLIVPKDYLMGGMFTHEWLINNGLNYIDIPANVFADDEQIAFAKNENGYHSYFGSIVSLKDKNYNREFAGIGYIKFESLESEDLSFYVYADYDPTNARSASYIANAAINDRSDLQDSEYKYYTGNNNYSPYTNTQRTFLETYITWSETSAVNSEVLGDLANKGGEQKITPTTQKLAGPYVELLYSTNVNVWGVFTYKDGSGKEANEDFYLQAGTTSHKQFLDIFRYNGVGYGMNTNNLSMTSITFTNAELANSDAPAGKVKVIALYSKNRTIDMDNQEIYVTVAQDDRSDMTVGAHLGLGGSLTYLAKSGIYEGVIGGNSGWNKGTVALRTNTSEFDAINKYKSGSSSDSYSEEAGYYGSAKGSMPNDGAVNLINNFDAGRQIQQSWYAQVGGSETATNGENGYTRAYCYTGSTEGQYWPYNPVQAGDVVSNPAQIVDYEQNLEKGYIYIKARAMDWAKGRDTNSSNSAHNNIPNTEIGGVTTKSYVENYYRLNADGTLTVNNSFVDWNGFEEMESCAWASTELPAVYPVHTLNYYVSNTNGDGSWTDTLEYKNDMKPWSGGTAYHQYANASRGDTKVEDWFAWANGGDENAFGLGVYIPNVDRYTSGRSYTGTNYYTDVNFQNANALPVDNYTTGGWFNKQDKVSDHAERGNILRDKGMMSNMQEIKYTYQSAYVSNTSYTAPGVDFRMEAYTPIEYSYVICLGTIKGIRETFKEIKDNGTITNAGSGYQKVGLDAWARADKKWTW